MHCRCYLIIWISPTSGRGEVFPEAASMMLKNQDHQIHNANHDGNQAADNPSNDRDEAEYRRDYSAGHPQDQNNQAAIAEKAGEG